MPADPPRRPDPGRFIAKNTRLAPVPTVPEIELYTAHPASGLRRLARPATDGADPPAPYWAYPWPGGVALARYLLDHPATVAGRRVLDLGAGSGLVAIAAAMAGAAAVTAADTDPYAVAAITLNAAANNVAIVARVGDPLAGDLPDSDIVLAGDVFYEPELAARVMAFLSRCREAGIDALVGDIGRAALPRHRLHLLAEYPVPDVGDGASAKRHAGGVFALA